MIFVRAVETKMGSLRALNTRPTSSAHIVAHAALVLAERAYANGNAEDAAHLVDVAHRLFGAALESPHFDAGLSH